MEKSLMLTDTQNGDAPTISDQKSRRLSLLSPFPDPGKTDFDVEREECLRAGSLFEDDEFQAKDAALYFSCHSPYKFSWLRPKDIAEKHGLKPHLFANLSPVFRVLQGDLGDSWVVAAFACLFENLELLYQILPHGQSFTDGWYAGVFRFKFWRYGIWEEVAVDDRLPTVGGNQVFVHSEEAYEFWPALMEKAYAKLHGSYEALKAGCLGDVLHDFTGGLVEAYSLRDQASLPTNLINTLFKALERQSLVACSVSPVPGRLHAMLQNGLMAGQTYTVTDMREIRMISDKGDAAITLLRLRNPWGHKVQWNGPWSESSPELSNIPQYDRQAMGLVCRDEGEYWMDFRDVVESFDKLDLCHLSPGDATNNNRKWCVNTFHGRWRRGLSAGGRPVATDSHWTNPQYCVTLTSPEPEEGGLCTCLVELTQRDRRRIKHKGIATADIGFVLYKIDSQQSLPLTREFFQENTFVSRCNYFSNARQISKRFVVNPGHYVVIPSTYTADTEADFMLRIWFEQDGNKAEYVDDSCSIAGLGPAPVDPALKERLDQFQRAFYDASGEDMEVNVYDFWKIINMGMSADSRYQDVSMDACKALVSVVDVEGASRLGYPDFLFLWNSIQMWKGVFVDHDPDTTGSIPAEDLRAILASLGYRLSFAVVSRLVFVFASDRCRLTLNDFILCLAKLLKAFNVFRCLTKDNRISLSLEQWLEVAMVL